MAAPTLDPSQAAHPAGRRPREAPGVTDLPRLTALTLGYGPGGIPGGGGTAGGGSTVIP